MRDFGLLESDLEDKSDKERLIMYMDLAFVLSCN